jgi:putative ABC transport system permease protein
MLNLIAVVLAIVCCFLCQPLLIKVTGAKSLDFISLFLTPEAIGWIGLILVAGIVFSSLYPVFMLASFKPVEVLKANKSVFKSAGIDIRKLLMIVQFTFGIGFTVGTYALYQQLQYMKNVDMGMDIKQVLVVEGFGAQPYSSYENFKTKLEALPSIKTVGTSSSAPSEEITNLSLRARIATNGDTSLIDKGLKLMTVDGDFFKALDVKFLSGRNFDASIPSDKEAVIVNEAAAKLLGYQDAGDATNDNLTWARSIMGDGSQSRIIGVIRNYHQLSLKNAHEPLAFIPSSSHEWQWNKRYYFIKFEDYSNRAGFQSMMNSVQESWKSAVKDEPFKYFFLDQYFGRQYKSDTTFNFLLILFSIMGVVIACLGLFGLVAYTTLQRTMEIGVRKVLGASIRSILVLLSKGFIKLMVVATAFSVPLIIWGLRHWLNQYAFRIELTWWLFALPVAVIFAIALLTVMLKSVKVAVRSPVESLRYE